MALEASCAKGEGVVLCGACVGTCTHASPLSEQEVQGLHVLAYEGNFFLF